MNPERLQWEVFPVDKKGKQCGSSVYVAAESQERALACGKYWRRMLSLKPAKTVVARRYHPERDPYMVARGFVKLTPNVQAHLPAESSEAACSRSGGAQG
ncbi:MAG: hypothetical protein BGO61_05490 [Thiobacillus sp. 65-69]|nr:MAG: hypothetical protein ABT21_09160 [Thiobacillus sp. SCN 65-179]OJW37764.1 MAG: hypothetical protein BGO61_05490 [Thiobacillus sp. 65-69]